MAEALFRKETLNRIEYSVRSAGVAASDGACCSRETQVVCDALSASLAGFRSQLISKELLEEATHVFAMTQGHLAALEKHFPEYSEKYYLACEFTELPGRGYGADVPDPYGMGKNAYDEVAATLQQAIPSILAYIDGTENTKRTD